MTLRIHASPAHREAPGKARGAIGREREKTDVKSTTPRGESMRLKSGQIERQAPLFWGCPSAVRCPRHARDFARLARVRNFPVASGHALSRLRRAARERAGVR
jgi:hypothetical protein